MGQVWGRRRTCGPRRLVWRGQLVCSISAGVGYSLGLTREGVRGYCYSSQLTIPPPCSDQTHASAGLHGLWLELGWEIAQVELDRGERWLFPRSTLNTCNVCLAFGMYSRQSWEAPLRWGGSCRPYCRWRCLLGFEREKSRNEGKGDCLLCQ